MIVLLAALFVTATPIVIDVAEPPAAPAPSCVIVHVADTHGPLQENLGLAAALAAETGVDLYTSSGDVAEALDLWSSWWDQPFGGLGPWLVAEGNHDVAGAEQLAAFEHRFSELPLDVVCGDVEVYALPWQVTASTAAWLEEVVADSTARFQVLLLHHPLWSAELGAWEGWDTRAVRDILAPVLGRIDLVLAGHDHVSWDSTHQVDGHTIRQVLVVSGPKTYACDQHAEGCVAHRREYLRIEAGEQLVVFHQEVTP